MSIDMDKIIALRKIDRDLKADSLALYKAEPKDRDSDEWYAWNAKYSRVISRVVESRRAYHAALDAMVDAEIAKQPEAPAP